MTERKTQPVFTAVQEQDLLRQRYAVRITLIAGIILLGVSIPDLFTIIPEASIEYFGNLATAIMGMVGLISAWFSYRYSGSRGSLLFCIALLIMVLGVPVYAHGLGLQAGIIVSAIVISIASAALPAQLAGRMTIATVIVAILVTLIDLFTPEFGLGTYQSPNATYFMLVMLVIFGYFIFRQLNAFTLQAKLILFFVMIAAFSVATAAYVSNNLARSEITRQVGNIQRTLAVRLAFDIGKELEAQVEILQAATTQFEELAEEISDGYSGDNAEILNNIQSLDEAWRAAPDDDPLIRRVLENDAANELRELQENFPSHVELFLTDKYGANFAATNRTSDYFQADEDWWKVSYNLGNGRVYLGQPEFDESSQTYSINIGIPVYSSSDEVVGIMRSTLDVSAIIESLNQGTTGITTQVDLRLINNTLISGVTLNEAELQGLSNVMGNFGQIPYQGKPSLVSQQRVFSSPNSSAEQAVSELGWSVIVHENLDDALQPVQNQSRAIILIALGTLVLAGLLGLFASQRLAAPIRSLTEVTKTISEGNLSMRADISTRDEIGALANSFNRMTGELQDTLNVLEQRVAERTTEVELARLVSERRAQDLQAISEVSRIISTEQKLDVLLPLVTRLVSERFDFYHVGIFFIDPTKQFAVLQASNSEGGKKMLERGHQLEVGLTGIVGTVAKTGKPRIALDVGTDAVFFNNPDLPETRSEMALPLNYRGDTIGVLDVQSTTPGAFSERDANTLGILADQIAIAIENARLFSQTQQARQEAENLYDQFLRTDWKSFMQEEQTIGYRQSIFGGKPILKPVQSEEIQRALDEGKVVVMDSVNPRSLPSLAIPVQLRGQTIGVLNIKASAKQHKWNTDEIALAQAISDRLALALDNARLLQESQRRAAKEAKISEVTSKISASINMKNVLQTAVEELGRALPGSEVIIQFGNGEKPH
jgi:GAF domain-containing protein/HAMP domain-containing protein